jgi:hypothetical protein
VTRPLAFIHIPKTSGTAVLSGLMALSAAAVVGRFDLLMFGSYRDFDSIEPELRGQICTSPASLHGLSGFLHGHLSLSTVLQGRPDAQRLTFLREPWSRLLSHWLFWRQQTDSDLAVWGGWGDRVKRCRGPLRDFLEDPLLACQTDNLMLRMLLWPHPLLPDDDFIDPANADELLRDATERLLKFDFIDIIEGGEFVPRLEAWTGQPFQYQRENETRHIADDFRRPLHAELTARAIELLDIRSRLDLHIWATIAGRHIPSQDVSRLRQQTLMANIARYALLMT